MDDAALKTMPILVVDDQPANVELLEQVLAGAGYVDVHGTEDPLEVEELVERLDPQLLILDLHMPRMDGFDLLEQLRPAERADVVLPVLILTADATSDATQRALALGAQDFVAKPFDFPELLLRVRNLLHTRRLAMELSSQRAGLYDQVIERTRELEDARLESLDRLALAAEYRDDVTGQHTLRIGRMAMLIGERLGMDAEALDHLRRAATLHDVGKIGIPDAILLKPGRLEPVEFEVMQRHATIGAQILGGSRSQLLQLAEEVALTHHEHWDGSGYPRGLAAEAIPPAGRIVAVADVFDALIHERPYKPAWPVQQALREIESSAESHFDPRVVEAFLALDPAGLAVLGG
jgi:putative two-component system response regulator